MRSAIEVQLVGQSWWGSWLPVLALGVSVFSVGLTLWLRRRDDARIVVHTSQSLITGLAVPTRFIVIEATNRGRSGSTRLTAMMLRTKDGRAIVSPGFAQMDSALPMRLEPGDGAAVYLDLADTARILAESGLKVRDVYPIARTGHGDYRGRLSPGLVQSLSRIAAARTVGET